MLHIIHVESNIFQTLQQIQYNIYVLERDELPADVLERVRSELKRDIEELERAVHVKANRVSELLSRKMN